MSTSFISLVSAIDSISLSSVPFLSPPCYSSSGIVTSTGLVIIRHVYLMTRYQVSSLSRTVTSRVASTISFTPESDSTFLLALLTVLSKDHSCSKSLLSLSARALSRASIDSYFTIIFLKPLICLEIGATNVLFSITSASTLCTSPRHCKHILHKTMNTP